MATRGLIGATLTGAAVGVGVALGGVSAATAAPAAGSMRVFAVDDSYTSSVHRATNFGASDRLMVGRIGEESRVSYLKFTVGALRQGAVVDGAQLSLPVAGTPDGAVISLRRLPSNAWSEKTITADLSPPVGAPIATVRPSRTDTVLRFNLSSVVNRPGTYSFAVTSAATSAVTRFRSVEYGDPTAGGPQLDVTLRAKTLSVDPVPQEPQTCTTGALLVPTCGVLWGAAAGGFSETPRDVALKQWEAASGRTATIFHTYHRGGELFPTPAEIAMTRDPAHPRVLMLNWKIDHGTTWAKVASGEQDARINRWADYVKTHYTDRFFLSLHHEPENDVQIAANSGMTAKDFAAMYRHVITMLRAKGITNAINVLAYMGNEKWMAKPWWNDLYPGDAYVDWVGLDSYVSAEKRTYHYGMFSDLLDRRGTRKSLGWYDWAVTQHPSKPVMIAEWGVYHRTGVKVDKSPAFNSVLPELAKRPNIKAILYFDCEVDMDGDRNINIATTPAGLTSFRALAANPIFNVTLTP